MWMYFPVERVLGNSMFPEFAYMVPLSSAVASEVTIIRHAALSLCDLLSVQFSFQSTVATDSGQRAVLHPKVQDPSCRHCACPMQGLLLFRHSRHFQPCPRSAFPSSCVTVRSANHFCCTRKGTGSSAECLLRKPLMLRKELFPRPETR